MLIPRAGLHSLVEVSLVCVLAKGLKPPPYFIRALPDPALLANGVVLRISETPDRPTKVTMSVIGLKLAEASEDPQAPVTAISLKRLCQPRGRGFTNAGRLSRPALGMHFFPGGAIGLKPSEACVDPKAPVARWGGANPESGAAHRAGWIPSGRRML